MKKYEKNILVNKNKEKIIEIPEFIDGPIPENLMYSDKTGTYKFTKEKGWVKLDEIRPK